jgi:hypothetical protein
MLRYVIRRLLDTCLDIWFHACDVQSQVKRLRILDLESQAREKLSKFVMLSTALMKPGLGTVAARAWKLKDCVQFAEGLGAAFRTLELHSTDVSELNTRTVFDSHHGYNTTANAQP